MNTEQKVLLAPNDMAEISEIASSQLYQTSGRATMQMASNADELNANQVQQY